MSASMPARVAALPVDPQRGLPVPWFVQWIDGKPDFRVVDSRKFAEAVRFDKCWICGQHRGRFGSFVIGPMCSVTRTNSEPPCHLECATYAAMTCPFLVKPHMRRREAGLPDGIKEAAGCGLKRNPGVACVWTTREWKLFGDGNGGVLWRMGDPSEARWYAEGREATHAEVEESVRSGLPLLRADEEGPEATAELARLLSIAERFYPAGVTL